MAGVFQTFRDYFWAESFWLPGNHTWDELKNTGDGVYRPQIEDLLVPIYTSVLLLIARILFERFIAQNIGRRFGLKSAARKAPENPILENSFKIKKAPTAYTITGLAKQTDLTTRQVERWFRIRRNQERTPVMKKFCESSWRGVYYFLIFWYGLYLHIDKPWFYDTSLCWLGWPSHHIPNDMYWYYMVEYGFYISLVYSLFFDNKRKDFTEMIVHHIATIVLMTLSWINNFVRIGTLVLLVHDAVDSWMEAAKVAKYIAMDRLCEVLFFTFMVIWVVTRMIIFPFRIIYSTMFEALPSMGGQDMPLLSMYIVYNMLLCVLQVLHVIWFYYICLIAKDAFMGQMQKDSRSSMESASESDNEKKPENNSNSHAHIGDEKKLKSESNGAVKSQTT